MKRNYLKGQNGITLIALVITIIILLILAGISIAMLTGDNGILSKARMSSNKSKEAAAKEQVELLIAEYQTEYYENKFINEGYNGSNRDYIIEKLKDGVDINNYYVQVDNEEEGTLNVYEKDKEELIVSGKINENALIEWDEEIEGIKVRYTLTPNTYTNENITLTINASSTNGEIANIQSELSKNDDETYTITENGDYEFVITDTTGASRTKTINIKKIDRIKPLDFEPSIINVTDKNFTISANAVDNESGIERYEYYIDGKEYKSTKGTYTVDIINGGVTHEIYVIAYDKAGNDKMSTKITYKTEARRQEIYIDSVSGSDQTGNGSKEKPYATLDKIADADIIQTGCVYNIMLNNGEYDLTTRIFELNCDETINIFGNKENTILKVDNLYANVGGGSRNYDVKIYRLIYKGTSFPPNTIHLFTDLYFYNVVFNFNDGGVAASYFCALNGAHYNFTNCIIPIVKDNLLRAMRDGSKVSLINCYGGFTISIHGVNDDWNYKNTNYLTSTPKVDTATYRIIEEDESIWKNKGEDQSGNPTNLGVYGGEYSWSK